MPGEILQEDARLRILVGVSVSGVKEKQVEMNDGMRRTWRMYPAFARPPWPRIVAEVCFLFFTWDKVKQADSKQE